MPYALSIKMGEGGIAVPLPIVSPDLKAMQKVVQAINELPSMSSAEEHNIIADLTDMEALRKVAEDIIASGVEEDSTEEDEGETPTIDESELDNGEA